MSALEDPAPSSPTLLPRSTEGEGSKDHMLVPKFTQIARSYLLHIGSLDWTQINPDIFGSMIQAVADDEERGALGMHYTSVPQPTLQEFAVGRHDGSFADIRLSSAQKLINY